MLYKQNCQYLHKFQSFWLAGSDIGSSATWGPFWSHNMLLMVVGSKNEPINSASWKICVKPQNIEIYSDQLTNVITLLFCVPRTHRS